MPFVVAFAILVLLLPPMVPSAMAQPVDVSSGDRVETLLRVFPNGLMPEQADAVLGVMGEAELRRDCTAAAGRTSGNQARRGGSRAAGSLRVVTRNDARFDAHSSPVSDVR